MDKVWELNQSYSHKIEFNKVTDPYVEAHKGMSDIYKAQHSGAEAVNNQIKRDSFKDRYKKWVQYREENQQKYVPKRHANLGPDLAVANFVVVRGGRVRFKHCPDVWATNLDHFPDRYDPRYHVVAVDASKTKLRYEGIDNFVEMNSLEALDLSDNKLDDWSCDKIGRMFRSSKLSFLDLSNNPMITHRGIETLHRVRSLKCLKIKGTEAAKYPFLDLLILLFNELVVDCNIISD